MTVDFKLTAIIIKSEKILYSYFVFFAILSPICTGKSQFLIVFKNACCALYLLLFFVVWYSPASGVDDGKLDCCTCQIGSINASTSNRSNYVVVVTIRNAVANNLSRRSSSSAAAAAAIAGYRQRMKYQSHRCLFIKCIVIKLQQRQGCSR